MDTLREWRLRRSAVTPEPFWGGGTVIMRRGTRAVGTAAATLEPQPSVKREQLVNMRERKCLLPQQPSRVSSTWIVHCRLLDGKWLLYLLVMLVYCTQCCKKINEYVGKTGARSVTILILWHYDKYEKVSQTNRFTEVQVLNRHVREVLVWRYRGLRFHEQFARVEDSSDHVVQRPWSDAIPAGGTPHSCHLCRNPGKRADTISRWYAWRQKVADFATGQRSTAYGSPDRGLAGETTRKESWTREGLRGLRADDLRGNVETR